MVFAIPSWKKKMGTSDFNFIKTAFAAHSVSSCSSPEASLNTPDLAHLHSSRAANHRTTVAQLTSTRE